MMKPGLLLIMVFSGLCGISAYGVSSEPEPDTSAECLACQEQVTELQLKWTNETTVEDLLADLKVKCSAYKNPAKEEVCDKIAEIFVQIPPALFQGMEDLAWPIPLATCATIRKCSVNCCVDQAPPEQVHLSLSSHDLSVMGVSWTSLNHNGTVVQYGLSSSELTLSSVGYNLTYTSAGWVGMLHRARMTGLKPATRYYYRVGDGGSLWSAVFSFKTFEVEQESVSYAMIGDMDFDTFSDDTVNSMIKLVDSGAIDCVIHSGDISYADGYEPHWDVFFNKVQPIASRIPYMVAPGNHEFWYNFSSYKARFFMPGVNDEGGSGDNMYYDYTVGKAHFFSMNSETAVDTANFSDQEIAWLTEALKTVDRGSTPWVIANFHRPMYCSNDDECNRQGGKLKSQAEDIIYGNHVDLVVTGHVHSYERTLPVYKEASTSSSYENAAAPVYILQGASGNREGNKGSYPPKDELPEWSAAQRTEVGFAVMTITSSQIDWKFYSSSTGETLDSVVISKSKI